MPPKITRKQAKILGNVYRGYEPPDLPQNRPPNRIKYWWKVIGKPMLTLYPQPEVEEWSKEPEYPPINDATKAGLRRQVRLDWYDSIRSKPTVEQKLHEINSKGFHYIAHINNWPPIANSLPFVKYLTQTHVVNTLPVGYETQASVQAGTGQTSDPAQVDAVKTTEPKSRIQQAILDQIALSKHESSTKQGRYFVSKQIRDYNRQAHISNRLIEQIYNQVKKALVYETNPQLLDYQVDLSPAIRSWWFHSGFKAPNNKPYYKYRKDDEGNVNTIFQMDGSSALNVRSEDMIEPVINMDDILVTDTSLVDKCGYSPKYYGATYKFKYPVALPGFWYNDPYRFDMPHTCFLSTDCLRIRQAAPFNQSTELKDTEDCLTSQAILTAFGWLNSLSMYHGYTPFHEIHYPFTCQVVTTDGQNWMFNVFQLNSHSFHRDLKGPQRNNICWSSGLMKLYENYQGGSFEGVNDDVVELLVKFMSRQTSPEYTSQLNLRPYLNEAADDRTQEAKDKMARALRDTFEGRYNRWLSNQWSVPEWERIFFRSKVTRHQITHMKPMWHIPKPKPPKEFE